MKTQSGNGHRVGQNETPAATTRGIRCWRDSDHRRSGANGAAFVAIGGVGLSLAEAKQMLGSIQHTMVQQQMEEYIDEQSRCSDCGRLLARKGQHEIVFRTLFGELRLRSPRFYLLDGKLEVQPHFWGSASFSLPSG